MVKKKPPTSSAHGRVKKKNGDKTKLGKLQKLKDRADKIRKDLKEITMLLEVKKEQKKKPKTPVFVPHKSIFPPNSFSANENDKALFVPKGTIVLIPTKDQIVGKELPKPAGPKQRLNARHRELGFNLIDSQWAMLRKEIETDQKQWVDGCIHDCPEHEV